MIAKIGVAKIWAKGVIAKKSSRTPGLRTIFISMGRKFHLCKYAYSDPYSTLTKRSINNDISKPKFDIFQKYILLQDFEKQF